MSTFCTFGRRTLILLAWSSMSYAYAPPVFAPCRKYSCRSGWSKKLPRAFRSEVAHSTSSPSTLNALRMISKATTIQEGVYTWLYSGGSFPIHLRSNGIFYCKSYPAAATWSFNGGVLFVDWKKYGKYELKAIDEKCICLEGSAAGQLSEWRKVQFERPFNDIEKRLISGSVWRWEHPGGSFEVEFHSDGFNHFVCKAFPAHAHWSLEGSQVTINWGSYGTYSLTLAADGTTMSGMVGGRQDDWRRATFLRGLVLDGPAADCKHDH